MPGAKASLVLFVVFLAIGCGGVPSGDDSPAEDTAVTPAAAPLAAPEHEPLPGLPPLSDQLVINLEVEVQPSGHALLRGETNLPEGTELMTSVAETAEGSDRITGFYGQDRAIVSRGRFTSGPFGRAGGLTPGRYEADATMPYPRTQSAAIQAVLGARGENLKGPLVERKEMGATAEVKRVFTVGSQAQQAAAGEAQEAAIADASESIQQLRHLVEQGRAMEALRGSSVSAAQQCGERMREYQRQTEMIVQRADAYPTLLRASIGAAAVQAGLCVSCSGSALGYCRATSEMIEDAEADLRDAQGSGQE